MIAKLAFFVTILTFINKSDGLSLQIIRGVNEKDIVEAVKQFMVGKNGLLYNLLTKDKINGTLRKGNKYDPMDVNKEEKYKKLTNKVLVKRIIPHGYPIGKYDYDKKFKTLYKPLVRVHKVRKIDNKDFTNKEYALDGVNFEPNKKAKDDYKLLFMIKKSDDIETDDVKLNNFPKSVLLEPFEVNNPKNPKSTKIHLNKNLIKYKTIGDENTKLKKILKNGNIIKLNNIESTNISNEKIYDIISSMLGKKDTGKKKLRVGRLLITKSVEEEEEYSPPRHFFQLSEEVNVKKPSMQYYPFWNFWTYDKQLYLDTCKGNSINVGGVCISRAR